MPQAKEKVRKAGEGWGWPLLAKKAHFFNGGRSICGSWLYRGANCAPNGTPGPDDCVQCVKLWRKQRGLDPEGMEEDFKPFEVSRRRLWPEDGWEEFQIDREQTYVVSPLSESRVKTNVGRECKVVAANSKKRVRIVWTTGRKGKKSIEPRDLSRAPTIIRFEFSGIIDDSDPKWIHPGKLKVGDIVEAEEYRGYKVVEVLARCPGKLKVDLPEGVKIFTRFSNSNHKFHDEHPHRTDAQVMLVI